MMLEAFVAELITLISLELNSPEDILMLFSIHL
jgi:hypothetical protein